MEDEKRHLEHLGAEGIRILKALGNSRLFLSFTSILREIGLSRTPGRKDLYRNILGNTVEKSTIKLTENSRNEILIWFHYVSLKKRKMEERKVFENDLRKIQYVSEIYDVAHHEWDYLIQVSTPGVFQQEDLSIYLQGHELVQKSGAAHHVRFVRNTPHHEIDGFFEKRPISELLADSEKKAPQ